MNKMKTHPLKNWVPYRLDFDTTEEVLCRWLYMGDLEFTEPFFYNTMAKCRALEVNNKSTFGGSTLEGIIEYSRDIPSIAPTAFIFHISRCGSTLLSQLLSLDKKNIVVSEPPIFDEILREIAFKNKNISSETISGTLTATIKFLGQKRTGLEENLFIKLDSWHIFYYNQIRELYPKTPFIFSYRRPDEVLRSQLKDAGMHAAPGVIQPEIFGFTLEEVLAVERPVYIAKVLEKYFERYWAIFNEDKNALFVNYEDGMITNIEKIFQFLGLKIEPSLKNRMVERTKFHSKKQGTIFHEEPIECMVPDYQKKVYNMYETLAQR